MHVAQRTFQVVFFFAASKTPSLRLMAAYGHDTIYGISLNIITESKILIVLFFRKFGADDIRICYTGG